MTEGFLNIIRWKTNLLCVVLSYFFVVWVGFCVWAQRGGREIEPQNRFVVFQHNFFHASRQTSVSKSSFQRVSSQHFKTTKSTMYSMECTIECAENCSVRCASAEFDGIDLRRRTSFSTNKERHTKFLTYTRNFTCTQNQIRAKAKPERTADAVQEALKQTAQAIQKEGCDDVNLRLELYEPSLQHTFSTSKL